MITVLFIVPNNQPCISQTIFFHGIHSGWKDAWQCDICGSKSGRGFGECFSILVLSLCSFQYDL